MAPDRLERLAALPILPGLKAEVTSPRTQAGFDA
jgi:hypothetical protein